MGESMSEPLLQQPQVNRRLRGTGAADRIRPRSDREDHEDKSIEGFTMAGLPKDSWQAWNTQSFHKCKSLEPLAKRIQNATEAQRPQRRDFITQKRRPSDHRKYLWPMTATNFPAAWNRATYPRARFQLQAEVDDDDDEPRDGWLLRIKQGKTTFPYSLVSHRAFIESQSTPNLKE